MSAPAERYSNDLVFKSLVDSFFAVLRDAKVTASELREAAMLAQQMYEERYPSPFYYDRDENRFIRERKW